MGYIRPFLKGERNGGRREKELLAFIEAHHSLL